MPWRDKQLPSRVRKHARSAIKRRAFKQAFESAQDQYEDEGTAWAFATAATKKAGRRKKSKGKKKKVTKSFRDYCQEYYD